MYEHTAEFQPASYVFGGLTASDLEGFYTFLDDVSWGDALHTLIGDNFALECLKEYAIMIYGVDELTPLVKERLTTNLIDLEN